MNVEQTQDYYQEFVINLASHLIPAHVVKEATKEGYDEVTWKSSRENWPKTDEEWNVAGNYQVIFVEATFQVGRNGHLTLFFGALLSSGSFLKSQFSFEALVRHSQETLNLVLGGDDGTAAKVIADHVADGLLRRPFVVENSYQGDRLPRNSEPTHLSVMLEYIGQYVKPGSLIRISMSDFASSNNYVSRDYMRCRSRWSRQQCDSINNVQSRKNEKISENVIEEWVASITSKSIAALHDGTTNIIRQLQAGSEECNISKIVRGNKCDSISSSEDHCKITPLSTVPTNTSSLKSNYEFSRREKQTLPTRKVNAKRRRGRVKIGTGNL